ncbi:hypothetical protein SUGI_0284710 [Cryptomeria japonica]|uniref:GTPase activating protein 1 n=1 Tax=Cryptomeria japonica TaxID=3369 RepID=UPI0024089581|nr:GTPase activating protein 1 [Cryptomeria japonica]GLJ16603.1 hypothetical protein SUGI_0284710 [Cryptomeria japonica]
MSKCVKVRVLKGMNLVVQDWASRSSDPYVLLRLSKNEARTKVVEKSLNPRWEEEFVLPITDCCLKLEVWDWDSPRKLKRDDPMGEAEIDLNHLVNGDTQIVLPTPENCYSKNSYIKLCADGKRVQEVSLMLRKGKVSTGVVELQLEYPA